MARLACLVALLSWAAEGVPRADKETVALVERFLETETADLPADKVPAFMAVAPAGLPKTLRLPFRAKRAELSALRKISDGKAKPSLRRLGRQGQAACRNEEVDDEDSAKLFNAMRRTGFVEIQESELQFLLLKTRCTECELQEEFSLMTFVIKAKKKRRKDKPRPKLKYMLNEGDPLWALIGLYREGNENPLGTNFFGTGIAPACR